MFWFDNIFSKFKYIPFEKICVASFIAGSILVVPSYALEIFSPGHVNIIDYTEKIDENYAFLDANRKKYNDIIESFGGRVPRGYYDEFYLKYKELDRQREHWVTLDTKQHEDKEHWIFDTAPYFGVAAFSTISFGLLGLVVSRL